jgi:hypothetical protein
MVVYARLQSQAEEFGYPVTTYAGMVLAQATLQAARTMGAMEAATTEAISRLVASEADDIGRE